MNVRLAANCPNDLLNPSSHALAVVGEVAEWSIAAVLKTASALRPTGVRIPPSPPAPGEDEDLTVV
jgi:hypothetical protein